MGGINSSTGSNIGDLIALQIKPGSEIEEKNKSN